MQRFNWKGWLAGAVRWSLLIDGVAAAVFSLFTVFKSPVWVHWTLALVVVEIAHWLALLTVCFAVAAWGLRRGHERLAWVTIGLCGIGCCLFLKPVAQAWRLGRALPGQLGAAFGEAKPAEKPFSIFAAIVPRAPREVAIETMEYGPSLALDFYRAVGREKAPCVVVVHGGSWVSGNQKDDGTKRWLNDWMAREGYAVASIDYRIAPKWIWPAQREDLLAAIAYLKANASRLGIDPTRFVLLGRSAGGQMVTATAYLVHDPAVRGIVAIYPPTDFRMTWESATHPGNLDHRLNLEWFLGGNPENAAAAYDSASGALLVDERSPPTLILQGSLDINVFQKQSELLDERLRAAGVPHALVVLPWATHAFDLVNFDSPSTQIETYSVDWFLQSVMR